MDGIVKYVYHGSKVGGLKLIEPKVSTHGISYVYAARSPEVAVTFIKNAGDLDFLYKIVDGRLIIVERWDGAFRNHYEGKEGFLYVLSGESFYEGKTSRSEDLVSELPAKVVDEKHLKDIGRELYAYHNNGNISIYLFNDQPEFVRELDNEDLVQKVSNWIVRSNKEEYFIEKVKTLHPYLLDRVYNRLDALRNDLS